MRGRLTYSNVVATIALFVSLGLGGAYAASKIKSKDIAKSAVTSKAIKDSTITGKDVKDGGLTGADVADGAIGSSKIGDGSIGASKIAADSIGANQIATGGVGSAEIADGAVGAADLTAPEPDRLIGVSGQPPFSTGGDGDCIWGDGSIASGGPPPSFYKDAEGRVHLGGLLKSTNGAGGDGVCDVSSIAEIFEDFRAFTLPVGYRPAHPEQLATATDSYNPISIYIGADHTANFGGIPLPAGDVIVVASSPTALTLDGLDFRAAP